MSALTMLNRKTEEKAIRGKRFKNLWMNITKTEKTPSTFTSDNNKNYQVYIKIRNRKKIPIIYIYIYK